MDLLLIRLHVQANWREDSFMNLAGFEKYDAALGKDEVDQIERLMIEQINSMTGQKLESVKLYHTLPVADHKIMLSMKGARVFSVNLLSRFCPCPFFETLEAF